jgi:hypothetical protein
LRRLPTVGNHDLTKAPEAVQATFLFAERYPYR